MSPAIDARLGIPSRVTITMLLALVGNIAAAQSIEGTATFRERMALPATAVLEATLEDVSRADAPAGTIARTRVSPAGNPPIAFTISYDPAKIIPGRRYAVRARILVDERLLFTTDTAAPVITSGHPRKVSLMLRKAGASQPPAQSRSELEGTSWQLVKFQGSDETTRVPDDRAKYTLTFGTGGRLTARIDCNRGQSTWKSSGPGELQFGPLAISRAQCPAGSLHDSILKHLALIRSYVIRDGHLFLSLMADGGIYEFEPMAKAS